MAEAQHTPGPWGFDAEGGHIFAKSGPLATFIVADIQSGRMGDAQLIAAAPDLLAALKEATSRLRQALSGSGTDAEFAEFAVAKYRDAIAKAEGRINA